MWKRFRSEQIQARGNRCELCGSIKKSDKDLDLHHLHPNEYDNLDPKLFKLLDTKCHELVEWVAIRLAVSQKDNSFPVREACIDWLGPFLPVSPRTVDALYAELRSSI